MKVLLDGSMSLAELPRDAKDRLDEMCCKGYELCLVDRPGASQLMKAYLESRHYPRVALMRHSDSRKVDDDLTEYSGEGSRTWCSAVWNRKTFSDLIVGCDAVMLIWDGYDKRTFIECIDAVACRVKLVEAWSPFSVGVITVHDYPDMYRLLPPAMHEAPAAETLQKRLDVAFPEMLEEFIPSVEMRTALRETVSPSKELVIDIIAGAPVALWYKQAWLERFADEEDLFRIILDDLGSAETDHMILSASESYPHLYHRSFTQCAEEVKHALAALECAVGEVLIVGEQAWDPDPDACGNTYGYWGFAPFETFEAVQSFIQEDLGSQDPCDSLSWYMLEKWVPWTDGRMGEAYCFTMVGDEPIFFTRYLPSKRGQETDWRPVSTTFDRSMRLQVPLPYRQGDVVKLDCRPFAPVRHACLFNWWGNDSERSIDYLYRNALGKWMLGSLLSGFGMDEQEHLSWLYRVEKIERGADGDTGANGSSDGDSNDNGDADSSGDGSGNGDTNDNDDELLWEVRQFVRVQKRNGEILWEILTASETVSHAREGFSDEELRAALSEAAQKAAVAP